MSIKPEDLVEKFQYMLNNKWGYIYGYAGKIHTQYAQNNATRQQTKKWGSKWVGRMCADCSGAFVWAFKQLGGYMYHGSNTMWNKYCTSKGQLKKGNRSDGQELKAGSAVFLNKNGDRHHVGLYIGNGKVIEAKGTFYGVVSSNVTAWDEWGQLKGVKYSDEEEPIVQTKEYKVSGGTGKLNLRKTASTAGVRVDQIPLGTIISCADYNDDWKYVPDYNGKSGYVMSKFVVLYEGGDEADDSDSGNSSSDSNNSSSGSSSAVDEETVTIKISKTVAKALYNALKEVL